MFSVSVTRALNSYETESLQIFDETALNLMAVFFLQQFREPSWMSVYTPDCLIIQSWGRLTLSHGKPSIYKANKRLQE